MNSRAVAIISYITWIGWIIALVVRDKSDLFVTQHINQALMINLIRCAASMMFFLPFFGRFVAWIVGIAVLALWLLGLYRAYKWNSEPLPVIGKAQIID